MALNIAELVVTKDELSRYFLRKAYEIAWDCSRDKQTKTGAIINYDPSSTTRKYQGVTRLGVAPQLIIPKIQEFTPGKDLSYYNKWIKSSGFNHLTPGLDNYPEWSDRPLKYDATVHAESDAISKAAKNGIEIDHTIMYMPWIPCTKCYILMENSGIKKLIAHKEMVEKSPPHWEEDLNKTLFLARQGKFEIILYEGKIGGVKALFNGEVWEP